MRWLNLVSGVLATIAWGWILYLGTGLVAAIACANLPEFPIVGTLLFNVIIPTAMLALVAASVLVTNRMKQPGRVIALFPCAALGSVLVYYAFVTGISISASVDISECPF
ncbi:MAG: hypothetical protein P0Y56_09275 [Candidatus Andeanibacterium colombiense]|uniref:Uncharacterized protein n=1 Tax=Candidatus Andeanibacterium colombiense TaxID=3121345 RepID=A0AAJ5X616_9SPHN|nr:MAG: hypothetical protein P0Y56_09275 [Sphingomonadaceae bacterium]